ncbi:PREDICTED: 28S ribosomal protein S30, mitochondrial [Polistes dominula]|uniref:28S ribosomal protein S30, mitochondrial n=1 Tax=Polistes dominula TaxID=743375 RepID=A0ABM1JG40_POLDO|nr:PREDICTED: 28S ribosomal protein S30, mitochondrial [Polistes dominula]
MFVHLHLRLFKNTVSVLKHGSKKYLTTVSNESQIAQTVHYPEILDMSREGRKRRGWQKWYDEIKRLPTVEEKLFKINMPRYYGWKSLLLDEHFIPYNSLDHAQYITRTYVIPERGLPDFYNNVITNEELESILNNIKSTIEDTIAFEYSSRKRKHELKEEELDSKVKMEEVVANSVVYQINRILQSNIVTIRPHLLEAQTDFDPRVEAFWFVGGIEPSGLTMSSRRRGWFKHTVNDPVHNTVQYYGKSVLHLRHDFPLNEIMSLKECEDSSFTVPQYKLDPRSLGYVFKYKHATNIPGFWPGDPCEFGLLSYHNCAYLAERKFDDKDDTLLTQAIFASYSWLLSQACYQGFSTFHDLTYPLVNQMAITNGQYWSLYVYQLNTTLLHSENSDENPRRNICWAKDSVKLFDKVEGEKVHGLNTDVLKSLIKFYANTPMKRNINMKPYLGQYVQKIADIKSDIRRDWLERYYKHLVTNRPRHRHAPEIYDWQKIYLIDNKMCPLMKKRHPFQFGIAVTRRRLDDHAKKWIPRRFRPIPTKKFGNYEHTYYP